MNNEIQKDSIYKRIGWPMVFFGGLSSVMYFFGYNFILLMWIDLAGPIIGWLIRLVLIFGGAGLLIFDKLFFSKRI
jgi:hypothetical protein